MENEIDFYIECWDMVNLTNDEIDALCDAVEDGDQKLADAIVDEAYSRLFGESVN